MKIIFFTRYDTIGSSSRYRFFNYQIYLKNYYEINIYPFFNNKYLKNKYSGKNNLINIFFCYLRRIFSLFKINNNTLIIIEKELFPYAPYYIEYFFLKKKKYILDFDDAIYLNYKKNINKILNTYNKIEKLTKNAKKIIVGSNNLYKYLYQYNKKIILIPTVVESIKYNRIRVKKFYTTTIVWIGTPSTVIYLEKILSILIKLKKKYNIQIISIGAKVNSKHVKSIEWSEKTEILYLKKCHIGVMPLVDDDWSRSKCGFKILQYMASELPVVASNVGQNKIIVDKNIGFLSSNYSDWYFNIEKLILNTDLREKFGKNGYKKLVKQYTYVSTFPKLLNLINETI